MMLIVQVSFKVAYEIVVLPLTSVVVKVLKKHEGVDVYDEDISYNPFRINDI